MLARSYCGVLYGGEDVSAHTTKTYREIKGRTLEPWTQDARHYGYNVERRPHYIRRLYEPRGMNGISCRRFSCSSTISLSCPTIFHSTHCTELHIAQLDTPTISARMNAVQEVCSVVGGKKNAEIR